MSFSLTEFARKIDAWVAAKLAQITETDRVLVVDALSATYAVALVKDGHDLGWGLSIEDGSGSEISASDIQRDFGPFRITFKKPPTPPSVSPLVTAAGLDDWLSRKPSSSVVWCARLQAAFETLAVKFLPWDGSGTGESVYEAESFPADPRKVVRDVDNNVPSSLSLWLLRAGIEVQWDDAAAMIWANRSAGALVNALANEIEADGMLVFRGPPLCRYCPSKQTASELGSDGFRALQNAARWAYEAPTEMETRHALLAAELARTNVGSVNAAALIRLGANAALEGARIAHGLGLHKLSLDSLKAMADLRKAVADEAAKLADATRQLAGAIAAATFAGIGVIGARLTLSSLDNVMVWTIAALGVVLCLYVGAVILSGRQFMQIQRELRAQWKDKLYRFLPPAEYQQMVEQPAKRAERAFNTAAVLGGILVAILLVAVLAVSFLAITPKSIPPASSPAPTAGTDQPSKP